MRHPLLFRLANYGWRTCLLLLALTAALAYTLGSPQTLKSALADSGVYQTASKQLTDQAVSRTVSETGPALNGVAEGTIRTAAAETFTPQAIRQTAERSIDNIYAWLSGETDTLDASIDTSAYARTYADKLVAGGTSEAVDDALREAQSLPACTPEQLQQIARQLEQGSIQEPPCSPLAGANEEAQQALKELLSGAAVNSEDLTAIVRDQAEQSIPPELQTIPAVETIRSLDYLPTAYRASMAAPWLFGFVALLSALGAVMWAGDRRAGSRKLARSLLGVGIALVVIAALVRLLIFTITKPDGPLASFAGNEFGGIFVKFISSVGQRWDAAVFLYGIAYIIVAVLMLLYIRRLQPALSQPAPHDQTPANT